MKKEIIPAYKEFNYLNEFMTELPVNCLFNKGKTGCGGTTIAIENNKNTIIAMPYVNVIKNKVVQYPNEKCSNVLFGIYEGITDKEIIDYINSHEIKKIAVTYNSLERLIGIMSRCGINAYSDYYLLVDEWHILFNSYAFRGQEIKKVLHHSKRFKEVTYMTATPIEDEYILTELKELPIVEVEWENTAIVNVATTKTNRPKNVVCKLIKDKLDSKIFGNLHFFVNSVEFIADVIKATEIKPEQVRIACSGNTKVSRGKKTNQSKLGIDYQIEDTTSEAKQINFYTSTSFEGCDIYDEQGKTYIVSDKSKSHTLLDISTLIIQICGRIRNSRYQLEINHIYSETKYNHFLSFDEFKNSTEEQIKKSKELISEINGMSDFARKTSIGLIEKNNKAGLNEMYIHNIENNLELDENLLKLDIVNFKITNHLYQSKITLSDEYKKYGFEVVPKADIYYTDKLKENPKARIPFKDLFEEYTKLRADKTMYFHFGNPEDRKSLIEQERPEIKDAYDILGIDKVRELKYNVTNIKRELYKGQSDISTDKKIIRCLSDRGVEVGVTKTASAMKQLLQEIYISLELKNANRKIRNAKATDLGNWFEIKKTTPKIEGKTTDCYTIIRSKIIYK